LQPLFVKPLKIFKEFDVFILSLNCRRRAAGKVAGGRRDGGGEGGRISARKAAKERSGKEGLRVVTWWNRTENPLKTKNLRSGSPRDTF